MPKCDFNKVAKQITLRHGCSPVNLLHIFRTPFYKNTYGALLLTIIFTNLVTIFTSLIDVHESIFSHVIPARNLLTKVLTCNFNVVN